VEITTVAHPVEPALLQGIELYDRAARQFGAFVFDNAG
jgi:hypothetical protein